MRALHGAIILICTYARPRARARHRSRPRPHPRSDQKGKPSEMSLGGKFGKVTVTSYATIYYQEDEFHLLQDFLLLGEGGGVYFEWWTILKLFAFFFYLYNWLYEGMQPVTIPIDDPWRNLCVPNRSRLSYDLLAARIGLYSYVIEIKCVCMLAIKNE